MEKGGLELESSEVKFKFKEEDGGISDILPKQPLEVHQIIEEAMVMANGYVAQRIYQGFRESAMLRHHPPPIESHFKMLLRAAESRVRIIFFVHVKTQMLIRIVSNCFSLLCVIGLLD